MVKVIFLCTGNSCRSQMAEGFTRAFGLGILEAHSAGLMPSGVNPKAIKVMKEAGVDISGQKSKGIDAALLEAMDIVITLCGHAEEMCPVTPPHIRRLHWPVNDPVGATGSETEILSVFRKTRDDIRKLVEELVRGLKREVL